MKVVNPMLNRILSALGCMFLSPAVSASPLPVSFEKLAKDCAPNVHVDTLRALITVESSGNPYAIGVVNGVLERQPRSLQEAVSTARRLEKEGFNFSMGLSQVNRHNLPKYGESYESIFEPCRNLRTGAAILTDCFKRASAKDSHDQAALRSALSCYYSGNFSRGFKPDAPGQPSYVQKVVNASTKAQTPFVPKISPSESDQGALSVRRSEPNQTRRGSNESASPWVIFNQARPEPPEQVEQRSKSSTGAVHVQMKTPRQSTPQETPFVQFLE